MAGTQLCRSRGGGGGGGQGTQQQRIKRTTFVKYADLWAEWWAKNWSKFVSSEAEAQLDLTRKTLDRCAESISKMPRSSPPTTIPCGPNVVVDGGVSNCLIKSFDEPQPGSMRAFLDMDSGRLPSPPQELLKGAADGVPSKELLAWAEQDGVDLIVVKTKLPGSEKPVYAFKPLGMKVWRIDNDRFDNLQTELSYGKTGPIGKPWNDMIAQIDENTGKFDDTLTASYLFITKEGICGAIRIQSPGSEAPAPVIPTTSKGGWQYKFIYERNPKDNGQVGGS